MPRLKICQNINVRHGKVLTQNLCLSLKKLELCFRVLHDQDECLWFYISLTPLDLAITPDFVLFACGKLCWNSERWNILCTLRVPFYSLHKQHTAAADPKMHSCHSTSNWNLISGVLLKVKWEDSGVKVCQVLKCVRRCILKSIMP